MLKRKSNKIPAEKEYFIKNPEGLLFTHLFASGGIQDKLNEILKTEVSFKPISLSMQPYHSINDKGKSVVMLSEFSEKIKGKALMLVPIKKVKKTAKKSSMDYKEFLVSSFEPVKYNFERLFKVSPEGCNISCIFAELSNYTNYGEYWCPVIKYNFDCGDDKLDFIAEQYISPGLLTSIYLYYLQEDLPEETKKSKERQLEALKELNKKFQAALVYEIDNFEESKIIIGGDGEALTDPAKLNLEELRLAPDFTIRLILEEITRRGIPAKTIVFAVQGMSEDLRAKILSNMSKNRRTEIRDGLRIWEGTGDEILLAQKEFAWIIVEMGEKSAIQVSRRLQKQLEAIIKEIDRELALRARSYLESGKFDSVIGSLNDVIFQILIRRVPRKVLVSAMTLLSAKLGRILDRNMTEAGMTMLLEDIEHWKSTIEDENDKITITAASKQAVEKKADLIIKEFRRSAF